MPPLLTPSVWKPRKRGGALAVLVAFLLTLVAHLAFVGVLLFLSLVQMNVPKMPAKATHRPVTLRPLSPEQWAMNRKTRSSLSAPENDSAVAQRESPAKQPEKQKPEQIPKGQVVDVSPGNGEESPDAKYLAERNNKVSKQTRAKEQTAFYRNAMPKHTSNVPQHTDGRDATDKIQIGGNNGLANDDRPLREKSAKSVFEVPDMKKRQEVAMRETRNGDGPGVKVSNRSESAEVTGNSDRFRIQQGEAGAPSGESSAGKRGTPGIANLVPSYSVLDKLSGAAPNDHLGEVDEGEGTYLNTKEWKYSTFFNRVKQTVRMHWDPGSQMRQRDPTGNIYGGKDRFTLLNVTLTERGTVKDIFIEKSCGIDFLDSEAISSFQRAQPFPNPPPGLLSLDQTVRFQFGFFLELGGGPRLRLFRSN